MRSLSVSVDRRAGRVLIGLTVLLSALLELEANSFEAILAPLLETGSQCRPIEGIHAWSPQARTLYEDDWIAKTLDLEPVEKESESFTCDDVRATVYLYRYASKSQAKKALNGVQLLIWGGGSSSKHHPEAIFAVEDVVVVVSGANPKPFAKLIRAGPREAK